MASSAGRMDAVESVLCLPKGDCDMGTFVLSCCMAVTLSRMRAMSWSHCGMLSCRYVKDFSMSDMVGVVLADPDPSSGVRWSA
jgi:hypothetical protein